MDKKKLRKSARLNGMLVADGDDESSDISFVASHSYLKTEHPKQKSPVINGSDSPSSSIKHKRMSHSSEKGEIGNEDMLADDDLQKNEASNSPSIQKKQKRSKKLPPADTPLNERAKRFHPSNHRSSAELKKIETASTVQSKQINPEPLLSSSTASLIEADSSAKTTETSIMVEEIASKPGTSDSATSKKGGNTQAMGVLLTQGLKSSDKDKLDTVFRTSDMAVIVQTLCDLNVAFVLPMLKELEKRLRTRKVVDITAWVRWIQVTLSVHTSYLTSLPNLSEELGSLHEWMTERTGSMRELLALQGKLVLITDNMQRRRQPQSFLSQQPSILFRDESEASSSDSSDMEDIAGMGRSLTGLSDTELDLDEWWDEPNHDDSASDEDDDENENEDEQDSEDGDSDSSTEEVMSKSKKRYGKSAQDRSESSEQSDENSMQVD